MEEPLTEDMLGELLSSPDPVRFIDEHEIEHRDLPGYLAFLLEAKGLNRPAVVAEAGIDTTHGYQIFVGQRNASRDKMIALAFALKCTLREANRLLRIAGHSELYVKDRRDAIIIFCIDRGYTLMATNEKLFQFGEEAIGR